VTPKSPGPQKTAVPLTRRYTRDDLAVFSRDEACRFLTSLPTTEPDASVGGGAGPYVALSLAWELLYRLEPELFDRLALAERLHPQILQWFPRHVERIVEAGSGTGRLTLALLGRCDSLVAIEPATPLRERLLRKLPLDEVNVRVIAGFLDALPVGDRSADLVVACSVLTPEPMHGGELGLREMERVCRPGGRVVVVWPNHLEWLGAQGYEHVSFPGEMVAEFASVDEAVELMSIFYPNAVAEIERRGSPRVPYAVFGVNPPRDLCYKIVR
jgi:SAM-dependent methyltransferase